MAAREPGLPDTAGGDPPRSAAVSTTAATAATATAPTKITRPAPKLISSSQA